MYCELILTLLVLLNDIPLSLSVDYHSQAAFDFDENNTLDPNEVMTMIQLIQNCSQQEAQTMAQRIFQAGDTDRNGSLDFNEMWQAMQTIPDCQQLIMKFSMN